jgi:hypothetical protein
MIWQPPAFTAFSTSRGEARKSSPGAAFENLDAFRQNRLWIDVGTALRPANTEMTLREAGSALPPRPQSDRGQPRGNIEGCAFFGRL